MPKLRPEVKEEWVRRLRSGAYHQGQGRLKQSDPARYCCLGVLAEMYMETQGEQWTSDNTTSDGMTCLPSYNCSAWAGTPDREFKVIAGGRLAFLSELNDEGVPFPVIADLIEEQL